MGIDCDLLGGTFGAQKYGILASCWECLCEQEGVTNFAKEGEMKVAPSVREITGRKGEIRK